mmetsp:Transcript_38691/g.54481  ORF Transcript_38691/g.54481 Transcript_38691/m.54481 type:complete len:116 (+) Transcript_38691:104-451(+)|eukprot:CAMPEP_0202459298 /NCGR_PEP_ID=MMETSP1360-20130828/34421_1 /ASSEMBLY_ACC=CAM_ASM_000848 /TAXON_ID=515479 /ORGANISM="Licmophora paradoxa, Strain CCMP2313" /LENGTH=115 /DNA_ID=CAMNT_0049080303 /DNA_START=52 /DNA_END=399 /DNA_ORIENTATION=-
MKTVATLLSCFLLIATFFTDVNAFQVGKFNVQQKVQKAQKAFNAKLLPAIAVMTATEPVWAKAKDTVPDVAPAYIGQEMAAGYLPAIMVPIVGLVFPALSMALFFLYVSADDLDA